MIILKSKNNISPILSLKILMQIRRTNIFKAKIIARDRECNLGIYYHSDSVNMNITIKKQIFVLPLLCNHIFLSDK